MRLVEFVIACVAVEVTPGPNMSYLVALALARGWTTGLRAAVGVACGMILVGLFCAAGLTALLDRQPAIETSLQWGGIVYMLWLAYESWRDPGNLLAVNQEDDLRTFWRGLVTNLLNPKLYIFYVAMLPEFANENGVSVFQNTMILVAVYAAIASTIHVLIVLSAAWVHLLIKQQMATRVVSRFMAVMLLGVAGWLAAEIRF